MLQVTGLSKSFGGTRALDNVNLEIRQGEIHALVGQNGSGKSTLIKILSGFHQADAGRMEAQGEPVRLPLSAQELRVLGISFVHQDLGLVPEGTVVENLRVGRYATGAGNRIRWREERERARELLGGFELEVDVEERVSCLSSTQRVILAVARAVADVEHRAGSGVLVLDEPTAALPAHEVELLFAAMRRVTERGTAALFVTHNLDEVLAIADRVTVIRDGRLVTTTEAAELDQESLVELIIGRPLGELYPELVLASGEPVIEVRNLSGRVAKDVSLTLHSGEIVGLTGLVGAGHDELPYLVYGAHAPRDGCVAVDGEVWTRPTPGRSKQAGIVLLPADREGQSGILSANVRENVTLPSLADYRRRGGLDLSRERADVQADLRRFSVQPPETERPLYSLSGGNQQKALLARWLRTNPRVLLLHEPTQGVDIGSRRGIFRILRDSVLAGTSVVYASVEYEDLANVCDRVLVFHRGSMVNTLSGSSLTADRIAEYCYRSREAA